MEGNGAVRSLTDIDFTELQRFLPVVRLPREIMELPPPPPSPRSEEEEAWEAILGSWTRLCNWMNEELTESNKATLERLLDDQAKLKRYNADCCKRTEEVNATLDGKDKLDNVDVWPRSPTPSCFYDWYKTYRMSNTSPTPLRSMRFTEPRAYKCRTGPLLQFFSLYFAGSFRHGESMSVYGFLAIRDDVDHLRSFVFCWSGGDALVIKPASFDLPLISPVRGISSLGPVLIEYNIKVKNNNGDSSCDDCEIIDGCFEYIPWSHYHNQKERRRIYGRLGPVDMQFMYISDAVEATIDVKVKWAGKGYNLKSVTAFTSGHPSGILLYDRPASSVVLSNKQYSICMDGCVIVSGCRGGGW